jgi:hypothetical protein
LPPTNLSSISPVPSSIGFSESSIGFSLCCIDRRHRRCLR